MLAGSLGGQPAVAVAERLAGLVDRVSQIGDLVQFLPGVQLHPLSPVVDFADPGPLFLVRALDPQR